MQAEIERGRAARRGQDVALVDEQDVGFQVYHRESRGELVRPAPVRGRPASIEDTRFGQRERAGAEAHQPRAPVRGAADGAEDRGGGRDTGVGPRGRDQRVGRVRRFDPGDPGQREHPEVHPDLGPRGAKREVVPWPVEFRAS